MGETVKYDDFELLAAYESNRDESAFADLVNRHSSWLLAAAQRSLGDQHLAEDAVQAVFVILAEKAGELSRPRQKSLAAWLFHVMHFTCARLRRTQMRQARREREAGLPNFNVTTPDGYQVAFFTAYVASGQPPVVLKH